MYYSVQAEIVDGDLDFDIQMPLGGSAVGRGRDLYDKALGTQEEQVKQIEGGRLFAERTEQNMKVFFARMSEGARAFFEFENSTMTYVN